MNNLSRIEISDKFDVIKYSTLKISGSKDSYILSLKSNKETENRLDLICKSTIDMETIPYLLSEKFL